MVVLGLGLIAAFGRVIQLGGFGVVSTSTNIILEGIVETARILLFLYVLGLANLKKGILRIKHLFTRKDTRKQQWLIAILGANRRCALAQGSRGCKIVEVDAEGDDAALGGDAR